MSEPAKIHRYTGTAATITWDAARCIHAAECVRRVPASFDPHAKPWIVPDAAPVRYARRRRESLSVGRTVGWSAPTACRRWSPLKTTPPGSTPAVRITSAASSCFA